VGKKFIGIIVIAMRIFFNELSIGCYSNREEACQGMYDVTSAIEELRRIGYCKEINLSRSFANLKLCNDYSVYSCCMDKIHHANERDKLRSFLTLFTKGPYIDDEFEAANMSGTVEYLFDDMQTVGLMMSYVFNGVAVSLSGDLRFADFEVFLKRRELLSDGTLRESECKTYSIKDAEMVKQKKFPLRERLLENIKTGKDILEHASRIFGNLEFCENAKKQLSGIHGHEEYFHELKRHLSVMNEYIELDGPFKPPGIDFAERESESTKQNRDLAQSRTFKCPDGTSRPFFAHSKIGSKYRIHVRPDISSKRVLVGYIGLHLPTSTHKH
jgi:hypothetical protein